MAGSTVHQLLYRSAAAQPFSDEQLEQLIARARVKNAEQQITGMLIYSNDMFVQILEGDTEAVRKMYRTIEQDKRHHAVTRLGERNIAAREFGDWWMGLEKIEGETPKGLANLAKPLTAANVDQFNTLGGYQLLRTVDSFSISPNSDCKQAQANSSLQSEDSLNREP